MKRYSYLKQQHNTWYFRIKIPPDLREFFDGKQEIVETLKTADLSIAQIKRLEKVAHWKNEFNRMRGNTDALKINAREIYHKTLEEEREGGYEITDEDEGDTGPGIVIDYLLSKASKELDKPEDEIEPSDLDDETRAKLDALVDYQKEQRTGRKTKPKQTYQETFEETAEQYIEYASKEWTSQTTGQTEAVFRLFKDYIKNRPLALVREEDVAGFLDEAETLSPHWGRSPKTKERSLAEIKALYGDDEEGLSGRTLNRYVSALHGLWKWGKQRNKCAGSNPTEGFYRKTKSNPWHPYLDNDLKKLFIPPHKSRKYFEIPYVALYSGMRLNEICSLEWENIREEDGVVYFDITAAKSEAGIRKVPLHPRLKWLAERAKKNKKQGLIWSELNPSGPDKKMSWNYSSGFSTFRKKRGAKSAAQYRISFHSFRKNVVRCFELSRVPQTEAAEIIGHEKAGITYRVYNPHGLTMQQRLDIVKTISYPEFEKAFEAAEMKAYT